MSLTFASVCSGIEAASCAWHPLGWQAEFFAEIDRFPCAVLERRWPGVPNYGDFTKIRDAGRIDVLVGGTPCQSFSVAGKRGGLDDPRGVLAFEFLKLAGRLRPRWVLFENVAGLLSSDEGRDFGAFLGALGKLGYGFCWRVLDAQYFGVAQRRERVFVVGYSGNPGRLAEKASTEELRRFSLISAAVLLERQSLSGDSAPRRTAREGTTSGLEVGPSGGRFTDTSCTLDARCKDGAIRNQVGMLAMCLNRHGGAGRMDAESETLIAHSLRVDGFDASEDGTGRGIPLVIEQNNMCSTPGLPSLRAHATPNYGIAFSCKDHGADAGDVAPTLRGMGHDRSHSNGGGQVAVAFQEAQTGVREYPTAGALRSNAPGPQPTGTLLRSGMQVRRLTPVECERLQGFPEDYTLAPYRGKLAADGPRYKAIGNSMAVPVMAWIGRRIEAVERILEAA